MLITDHEVLWIEVIQFFLCKESHYLRCVFCYTLRISYIKQIADFEVSRKCLHSFLSSLLHQSGNLLYSLVWEWPPILLSHSGYDHLHVIHRVKIILLIYYGTDWYLLTLSGTRILFVGWPLVLSDNGFGLFWWQWMWNTAQGLWLLL